MAELGEASLGLVSAQPNSTRRTLAGLLSQAALELGQRAGMRLAAAPGIAVHRGTLPRLAPGPPGPVASAAPDMAGVDDFALRHGHVCATVLAGPCSWQATTPASFLVAGIQRPATRGTSTLDLKPAEFLQQEEKSWNLRQADRMQTPPSSPSSSSGVTTP